MTKKKYSKYNLERPEWERILIGIYHYCCAHMDHTSFTVGYKDATYFIHIHAGTKCPDIIKEFAIRNSIILK